MRNLYKTLTLKNVVVKVYDTVDKVEKEIPSAYYPEVQDRPRIPDGCVEISFDTIKEERVKLKMTALAFVEGAEVVED